MVVCWTLEVLNAPEIGFGAAQLCRIPHNCWVAPVDKWEDFITEFPSPSALLPLNSLAACQLLRRRNSTPQWSYLAKKSGPSERSAGPNRIEVEGGISAKNQRWGRPWGLYAAGETQKSDFSCPDPTLFHSQFYHMKGANATHVSTHFSSSRFKVAPTAAFSSSVIFCTAPSLVHWNKNQKLRGIPLPSAIGCSNDKFPTQTDSNSAAELLRHLIVVPL